MTGQLQGWLKGDRSRGFMTLISVLYLCFMLAGDICRGGNEQGDEHGDREKDKEGGRKSLGIGL